MSISFIHLFTHSCIHSFTLQGWGWNVLVKHSATEPHPQASCYSLCSFLHAMPVVSKNLHNTVIF